MPEATNILQLIKQYWYVVVIIIAGFVIFYLVTKLKSKHKPILISREEVQRKDFIKKNRLNLTDRRIKYFKIGSKTMGVIKSLRGDIAQDMTINKEGTKANPIEGSNPIQIYEIVYRPLLFGLFPSPFADDIPIIISKEHTWVTFSDKSLHLLASVPIDLHPKADIYYEIRNDVNLKDFVTDSSIYRVDMGKMSDGYFRFTQEQSTYDQDKGHATLSKAQDIELAEKQRQKLVT
jgi:hypothetical protein